MLLIAFVSFLCALVAALVGFGGLAAGIAVVAQLLFFVFVGMAVAALALNLAVDGARGR